MFQREAPTGNEPAAKKQRTDMSESDFTAQHGNSGTFRVQVPTDSSQANMTGQVLNISLPYMSTVKDLKSAIEKEIGLPAKSQKLKTDVFLKDAFTLAKHNVVSGTLIELGVQKRGGQG